MASGLHGRWKIDGETVIDFIFLGSKSTADGDCSHEIKRCLLFGRKAITNLDNIFKSRDITLPTKIHVVKAMVFSSSHIHTWLLEKTIALTSWAFVSKVTSLLLNKLSRLVIAFLPRSKCLLISWRQSLSAIILETNKQSLPVFPLFSHLFAMTWWDQMPWS